jgi:hypothetical protein
MPALHEIPLKKIIATPVISHLQIAGPGNELSGGKLQSILKPI